MTLHGPKTKWTPSESSDTFNGPEPSLAKFRKLASMATATASRAVGGL